jgi:epoxyqueuosine reductase
MKKKKFELEVPGGSDKVLLHTCCAPCSSAIIECLLNHGIRPTIYYCNPNIYPLEEYNIRKDECTRYAQSLGLDIVDADYDHAFWRCTVAGLENEPERGGRCLKCFKMRLAATRSLPIAHNTIASFSDTPCDCIKRDSSSERARKSSLITQIHFIFSILK